VRDPPDKGLSMGGWSLRQTWGESERLTGAIFGQDSARSAGWETSLELRQCRGCCWWRAQRLERETEKANRWPGGYVNNEQCNAREPRSWQLSAQDSVKDEQFWGRAVRSAPRSNRILGRSLLQTLIWGNLPPITSLYWVHKSTYCLSFPRRWRRAIPSALRARYCLWNKSRRPAKRDG